MLFSILPPSFFLKPYSAKDEVTHILHVSKELQSLEDVIESQSDFLGIDANDENS